MSEITDGTSNTVAYSEAVTAAFQGATSVKGGIACNAGFAEPNGEARFATLPFSALSAHDGRPDAFNSARVRLFAIGAVVFRWKTTFQIKRNGRKIEWKINAEMK